MPEAHPLLAAVTSGLWAQLAFIGAAAAIVYLRGPARDHWQRALNIRRHPARFARVLATVATVAFGVMVVTGMALTAEPRPPRPRASVAVVTDPGSDVRRASFVLYDPVPGGAEQLSPDALSGASY